MNTTKNQGNGSPTTQLTSEQRLAQYREEVRKTFQSMSDQALHFQDARISMNPCIDRQEINREMQRRGI